MQVKDLDNLIQTNLESITELKSRMLSIGNELKPDRVQSSNSYDCTDIIAKICDMEDVDHIITDLKISKATANRIEELGIDLTIVEDFRHY